VILFALWRRGLLRRLDGETARQFFGVRRDPLSLARRYPMWRALRVTRLLVSPAYARSVARWLEYRLNLYDGLEG